jgi:hypothetical protein
MIKLRNIMSQTLRETTSTQRTFYAGKITRIVDATIEQCDKAAFLPFPELQ